MHLNSGSWSCLTTSSVSSFSAPALASFYISEKLASFFLFLAAFTRPNASRFVFFNSGMVHHVLSLRLRAPFSIGRPSGHSDRLLMYIYTSSMLHFEPMAHSDGVRVWCQSTAGFLWLRPHTSSTFVLPSPSVYVYCCGARTLSVCGASEADDTFSTTDDTFSPTDECWS